MTMAAFNQELIFLFVCIQFQEILKPNYNSVDLAEVELVDTYLDEPRGNDSQLLAVSLKNKSLIYMKTVETRQNV